MWPPALRKQADSYFELEGLIRDHLMGSGGVSLARLHRLLTETQLVTLPLWLLGSNADKQAIAEAIDATGTDDPEITAHVQYQLGLGTLAKRDYVTASELFATVSRGDDHPRVAYQQMYALCMAGRFDDARGFAAISPDSTTTQNARYWRFLDATFGVRR
jgi:hypothetical protein